MIYSLQILRGIAAMMVVFYHYATWGEVSVFADYPVLQRIFSDGYFGVNLFFIISGFIMYQVTRKDDDPVRFITKRLLRIIPLYWLMLLTHRGVQAFADIDTLKSMFFIPLSLERPPFFGYSTYVVGWTLNYEMFFYLLFGVALYFKRFKIAFIFIVFALLHAVFCFYSDASFAQSFNPYTASSVTIPYFAMAINPFTLVFAIGIIFGYLYEKLRQCKFVYHTIAFVLFVGLFICCSNYFCNLDGHNIRATLLSMILFAIFISAEKLIVSNKIVFNIARPFVFLGTISYSIYLTHLLFASNYALKHIEGMNIFLNLALVLSIIIIISCITYYLVEKKFTNFLSGKIKWLHKPV